MRTILFALNVCFHFSVHDLQVLEKTLPTLLKLEAYHRVGGGHRLKQIPECVYMEAAKYAASSLAIKNFNVFQLADDFEFIYVNSTPDVGGVVSDLRVRKLRDSLNGDNSAFFKDIATCQKYMTGLEEVILNKTDPDCCVEGNSCTCNYFWRWRDCPHILAVLEVRKHIKIEHEIAPAYKANAPTGRRKQNARGRGAR